MLALLSAGCGIAVNSMETTVAGVGQSGGLAADYFDAEAFEGALREQLATEPENVLVSDIMRLFDYRRDARFSVGSRVAEASEQKKELYKRLHSSAANIGAALAELAIQKDTSNQGRKPHQIPGARCVGDHPVLWPLAVPGLTLGQYVTMEDFIELGRFLEDWPRIVDTVYALAINPTTYNNETIVATLKSLVETDMSYGFRSQMYGVLFRHIQCTGYGDLEGFLEGGTAHK